jgi:glycosyltransferase involved in cell wall biosynthesis
MIKGGSQVQSSTCLNRLYSSELPRLRPVNEQPDRKPLSYDGRTALNGSQEGMRVCYVTNVGWPQGGAEKSIELLRETLVERGDTVCVVATDVGAAGRSDVFADALIPHISGGPLRRLRQYFFYRTAYRELRRLFKSFRPDIVHFHTVGELSPAALLSARDIPSVITVHGPEDFTLALNPWNLPASDYRNGTYRRSDLRVIGRLRSLYLGYIQRPAYLFALRRCDALVAPSAFMASVLERDIDAGRIVHINNGIDIPDAAHPPNEGRFLYVGRLVAYKGVDVLLRSFARARETHPGITLMIAGDGADRGALEVLTAQLGLSEDVTFLGAVAPKDVLQAYVNCDALVIPSVCPENLPTVAIEAMGVGRAIVASRIGGIPELVDDGVNGLLAEPYDEVALADSMVRLASQPDLCRRMGEAGRRGAAAYTTTTFVSNIRDLYDRTVTTAAARSAS